MNLPVRFDSIIVGLLNRYLLIQLFAEVIRRLSFLIGVARHLLPISLAGPLRDISPSIPTVSEVLVGLREALPKVSKGDSLLFQKLVKLITCKATVVCGNLELEKDKVNCFLRVHHLFRFIMIRSICLIFVSVLVSLNDGKTWAPSTARPVNLSDDDIEDLHDDLPLVSRRVSRNIRGWDGGFGNNETRRPRERNGDILLIISLFAVMKVLFNLWHIWNDS